RVTTHGHRGAPQHVVAGGRRTERVVAAEIDGGQQVAQAAGCVVEDPHARDGHRIRTSLERAHDALDPVLRDDRVGVEPGDHRASRSVVPGGCGGGDADCRLVVVVRVVCPGDGDRVVGAAVVHDDHL